MNVVPLKSPTSSVMWKDKPAGRKKNEAYGRQREHLFPEELERLFAALKHNRHAHRDYMIVLVTILHGLRVGELIALRWNDINWRVGTIDIRRLKDGVDGTHYMERDEVNGLKRLEREQDPKSPYVFTSERGTPFTRFAINKLVETAGKNAKLEFKVHPHCLRHTTGYTQANGGMTAWHLQKLMGHASMTNTVKYVRMSPEPLKDAWRGKKFWK